MNILDEVDKYLVRFQTGKTRVLYALEDNLLLSVATDKITAFGFSLSALIPEKGEHHSALNIFWRELLSRMWHVHGDNSVFRHDLVDFGIAIDQKIPAELRNNPELQKRAVVIRKYSVLPYEFCVRGYLVGSTLETYRRTGKIQGQKPGVTLHSGFKLPTTIFVPKTKVEVGLGKDVSPQLIKELYGPNVEIFCKKMFLLASQYAASRGLVLVDSRFECALDEQGNVILVDELLTTDTSRFWDAREYELHHISGVRSSLHEQDKELIRNYARSLGIAKASPLAVEDPDWVASLPINPSIVSKMAGVNSHVFVTLTGKKLEAFQKDAHMR